MKIKFGTYALGALLSLAIVLSVMPASYAQNNLNSLRKSDSGEKSLEELSREEPKEKFSSKKTDDMTVAILFHKLTGQKPNFESWARKLNKDFEGSDYEKQARISETGRKLEQKFDLTVFDEPIHIEGFATLKQHSKEGGGFFVQEFTKDTFFTYKFNGEYYAVIPTDLMDNQWIEVDIKDMVDFEYHTGGKDQLFMRLTLAPLQADKSQKIPLANGHENWLLATKVLDLEFWSPRDKTLVWRKNDNAAQVKNELLNLYR